MRFEYLELTSPVANRSPHGGPPDNKRAYHYDYSYYQGYGEDEFGHFNAGGVEDDSPQK